MDFPLRLGLRPASLPRWLLCACLLVELTSCANFRRLGKDLEKMDKAGTISGKIDAGDWAGQSIDVYLFDVEASVGKPVRVSQLVTLKEPGRYGFHVRAGHYMLAALEDLDGDEHLTAGEPHAVYDDLAIVTVAEREDVKRINMELSTVRAPALDTIAVERDEVVATDYDFHIGAVASLDDPRFDPANGPLGMWQPYEFFERLGAGVFMLEEYDANKTPVLFIHGMSGHPREFATLIDGLDSETYQAWVYQYPSGARLQKVVDALSGILETVRAKRGFTRLCLVAHSMGGLVVHRLVRDQAAAGLDRYVKLVTTISSPLGGIPSADTGVKMAPEVVPSWRDVGPKSEFVRSLFERPFPDDIRYVMYFGFGEGSKRSKGATDGVVPVWSQLPREAQEDADFISGFAESHTGILRNDATVQQLNRDLWRCLDSP